MRFAHRAASEAGLARERLQALKSVGGKSSNIYGDKRSFLRFLLGLQEGTLPFVPLLVKSQFVSQGIFFFYYVDCKNSLSAPYIRSAWA